MEGQFCTVDIVEFQRAFFELREQLVYRYQGVLFVDRNLEESGNFYQKLNGGVLENSRQLVGNAIEINKSIPIEYFGSQIGTHSKPKDEHITC